MTSKTKPCHHFGDGPVIILVTVTDGPVTILVTPCHHFGDGLPRFCCPPCHHFGDILNNHTPQRSPVTLSAKHAGRPVDTKDRTDGLHACQPVCAGRQLGPTVGIQIGGGERGGGSSCLSPKKNGEGS